MGRARLVEGQPCRYGHPWFRSADKKRCLACYPPPAPPPPKPPKFVRPPRVALSPQDRRLRKLQQQRVKREEKRAQRLTLGLLANSVQPHRLGRRRRLYARQGGRCALTGLPLAGAVVHVDHIIPVTRGGTDEESNLQLVVRAANMAKGNGTCEEFQTWLLAAADALRQKMKLESLC